MRLFVRKSIVNNTVDKYKIVFLEDRTVILLNNKQICEFTKDAGVTLPYEILDYLNRR